MVKSNSGIRRAGRDKATACNPSWARSFRLRGAKHPLSPESRAPDCFQRVEGQPHRIALREDEKGVPRNQLPINLSCQLPKQALRSIPPDCPSETLPHHDAHAGVIIFRSADQQIERWSRQAAPVLLDMFDVTTRAEEPFSVSSSPFSCHTSSPASQDRASSC